MKWRKNMLWRYTWLFGVAVVMASLVVSLKHVTLYWQEKETDECSISALISTEIAKPRCRLYASKQLNMLVGETKQTAYGYTRKEVKEDTSYTVLPGLRFIRGPTRETTRSPEVGSMMERDGKVDMQPKVEPGTGPGIESGKEFDMKPNVQPNVQPVVKTIIKPKVESIEVPITNSAKPQHPAQKQPLRSTYRKRKNWRESRRSDHSIRSIPSSVKRPNVTAHEQYGTEAFRKEANHHILDMEGRGACSSENCRAFVGSQRVDFDSSTDWKYYPDRVEVTMIATATLNRLQFVNSLAARWNGPLCISVWTNEESVNEVESTIESLSASKQVQFILYVAKPDHIFYYDFPVNYLRNLCIRHIKTSHFMFLDFDMWPTETLHEHLLSLPSALLEDPTAAVIIPPVFLKSGLVMRQCRSLERCFMKSREMAPQNVKELLKCKEKDVCLFTKEGGFAHLLVKKELFSITDSLVAKISCFPWRLQEPYMVLKYTPDLPLFDERFVNYGYNKIEYTEQLRYYVRNFFILTQDFAVDMVHAKSKFAQVFKAAINTKNKPEMDQLWHIFRTELGVSYKTRRVPSGCGSNLQLYKPAKL